MINRLYIKSLEQINELRNENNNLKKGYENIIMEIKYRDNIIFNLMNKLKEKDTLTQIHIDK